MNFHVNKIFQRFFREDEIPYIIILSGVTSVLFLTKCNQDNNYDSCSIIIIMNKRKAENKKENNSYKMW